ncbi:MAG: adenylyl-sulfate kinase, partial [Verrucomicrobia bacterium]|nr:adenylyl-sulfate kinase [Verrucomicrobiota bacterium]
VNGSHALMIFWFTGQPGSGKSTLARALGTALQARGYQVASLDGDELRRQTRNTDYSDAGRSLNVRTGQRRAAELAAGGFVVVAAFVSPHRTLREEFKANHEVVEIYVHTTKATSKDVFRVPHYEPPLARYIDLDTALLTVDQCVQAVLDAFPQRKS